MKKILTVLCSFILITAISSSVFAKEGQSDSYWGNIPEDTTFAFVDSRYYDGTDYVKVFNVGFYLGDSGEYYTNGDWTDLTNVYRREDYYKNQEFIDYTNNATPGQEPRPEGYPTNEMVNYHLTMQEHILPYHGQTFQCSEEEPAKTMIQVV